MRTEHDIKADEFLKNYRLCLHAELQNEPRCPPWVEFTTMLYAPDDDLCCDFCGHLHGESYRVSLMRKDSDKMLEFDFWHAPSFRGQRPDEYYLLAGVSYWTHWEKSFMALCDKFPEIQHDLARKLLNQSWSFFHFFDEAERADLFSIQ